MKTTTKTTQRKQAENEAEKIRKMLEREGYEFFKMTDNYVYAISPTWFCRINDRSDLEEFLSDWELLDSPWDAYRKQIGILLQKVITECAIEPRSDSVRWEDVPEDVTLPERQRFTDRVSAYLTACFDHDYNNKMKGN